MILDMSDFKNIFKNTDFHLPIRWNNTDFVKTLHLLYENYQKNIEAYATKYFGHMDSGSEIYVDEKRIKSICKRIENAVQAYLNGFPSRAFTNFSKILEELQNTPLRIYKNLIIDKQPLDDALPLYRVTCVNDNIPYKRERVFHTPYNLRSKIATTRYSIAGFPSLYLGTSLELCCEEIHMNPHTQFALASRFDWNLSVKKEIRIIDLAIKPQDFLDQESPSHKNNTRYKQIKHSLLNQADICEAYLLWYPLIAACSYIRVAKNDPFAVEYIIPQLLMQWVRKENDHEELVGIRYFSCASVRASDMGFNYVFPTVTKIESSQYCPILAQSFVLTKPHYIHEYDNIERCEEALRHDADLKFI